MDVRFELVRHLAPVVPSTVLDLIERLSGSSGLDELKQRECPNRQSIMSLLRKLAWFPEHFRRAALLLSRFIQAELSNDDRNQDTSYLEQLFWPLLSGTKARPQERRKVVEEMLSAPDSLSQNTGMIALRGMLQAGQFTSSHDFSFGARAVDFGWHPETAADYQDWYGGALEIAGRLALSESGLRNAARQAIAEQLRGLWCLGYVFDQLEEAAVSIGADEHWPEGWLAVGRTLRRDSERMEESLVARLLALQERLAPTGVRERVQSYVLTPAHKVTDARHGRTAQDYTQAFEAVVDDARRLGRETGRDRELFEALWSELFGPNAHQANWFGEGLAETMLDLSEAWAHLLDRYGAIEHEQRNPALLSGFIRGAAARDKVKVEGFLDDAVCDQLLGHVFPFLQVSFEIDEAGIRRLIDSIEAGLAPPHVYWNLVLGRTTESIPPTDLSRIVLGIAGLPDGQDIAMEILSMHFHGQSDNQSRMDASILDCGRQLLRSYPLDQLQHITDYRLAAIAKICLRGDDAAEDSALICRRIADASTERLIHSVELSGFVEAMLSLHPLVALDCWLEGKPDTWGRQAGRWVADIEDRNPLGKVPPPILLEWAQRNPDTRFSKLASVIPALVNEDNATAWSETALALLSAAPDRAAVLRGLTARLHPSGWSGSLADILEQRRPLIQHFLDDEDPAVRQVAREFGDALLTDIAAERSREVNRDERFE